MLQLAAGSILPAVYLLIESSYAGKRVEELVGHIPISYLTKAIYWLSSVRSGLGIAEAGFAQLEEWQQSDGNLIDE